MKNTLNSGCVDIWLDEIVPCLKDTETGEIKVALRICIGLVLLHITTKHLRKPLNIAVLEDFFLRLLWIVRLRGSMKVLFTDLPLTKSC